MASHKSAEKRIRQSAKRTAINRARISRVRTFVKKVEMAIATGNKEAARSAFQVAQPELHRAITKGLLHKNTVSRKLSRLATRINALWTRVRGKNVRQSVAKWHLPWRIGQSRALRVRRGDRRRAEPNPRSLFDPVATIAPPNLKSWVMGLQSRCCRVNTDEREENVLFFTNNNSN
jgi:small subunit ribosomal protein S20